MATPIIDFISSPAQLDHTYDILVPDTNILLTYPFLIPSLTHPSLPSTPSIDFNHKHIVIPSIIDDELDRLKSQHISISVAARNAIRRLEKLSSYRDNNICLEDCFTLKGSYALQNNIRIRYSDETTSEDIDILFSFWSVGDDIAASPLYPGPTDSDGKIIAAALNIEKTAWFETEHYAPTVTVLSNDHNFRFRARNFGLKAASYDLAGADAYSGRRTVSAPRIIFSSLIRNGYIPGDLWRQYLPNEPILYPNEFVIFRTPQQKKSKQAPTKNKRTQRRRKRTEQSAQEVQPEPVDISTKPPSERFNYIGRYDADLDRIVALQYLDQSPVVPENIGQAIHVEAMMNPKIGVIIVDNNPHYHSKHVAVVSYRTKEPAFTDDIYDAFGFN